MEMLSRQDAEDRVKIAGGKVMSSVSGNTTYLVLGSRLEDGRPVEETSKYRKYTELKNKGKKWPTLLTEAEFASMLPGDSKASPAMAPVTATSSTSAGSSQTASASTSQASAPAANASGTTRTSVKELSNWVDTHAPRDFG